MIAVTEQGLVNHSQDVLLLTKSEVVHSPSQISCELLLVCDDEQLLMLT